MKYLAAAALGALVMGFFLAAAFAAPVQAAPQLLFTDLASGPPGAFVTVWGYELIGAPIRCNNLPCDMVAPSAPDARLPAHGRQPGIDKLVVRLSGAPGGNFIITADSGATGALQVRVVSGKILQVSLGRNINSVIASAGLGDVIYLRQGVYRDTTGSGSYGAVAFFRDRANLALSCWPGERCVIDLAAGNISAIGGMTGVTLSNLIVQGGGSGTAFAFNRSTSGRLRLGTRIVGNHVANAGSASGGAFGSFGAHAGLVIAGNSTLQTGVAGSNQAQNVYLTGNGANSNILIGWNRLLGHKGGRHIQVYGHQAGESMTGLRILQNNIEGAAGSSDGILVSHTDGQSGAPESRCWIRDALVSGNTVRNVSRHGIQILNCALDPAIVEDNVVFATGQRTILGQAFRSMRTQGNCLDEAPRFNPAFVNHTESGNRIDYPLCL